MYLLSDNLLEIVFFLFGWSTKKGALYQSRNKLEFQAMFTQTDIPIMPSEEAASLALLDGWFGNSVP